MPHQSLCQQHHQGEKPSGNGEISFAICPSAGAHSCFQEGTICVGNTSQNIAMAWILQMLICWYMQHHQRTYFSHLTTWCHCHFKCWDACGPQCQSQDPHDTFEFYGPWHSNQRSSWLLTEWPQVWWTAESNQSNHFHTWIVYLMDLWLITLKFQVQCIKYWHAVQHEQYTQFSARVIQMLMDGHRLGRWFLRFFFGLGWVWLAHYVGPSWGWLSHISWAIIIYIYICYLYQFLRATVLVKISSYIYIYCHKTFGIPQLFSQIKIEKQSDMNSSGAKCHFFYNNLPFFFSSPWFFLSLLQGSWQPLL